MLAAAGGEAGHLLLYGGSRSGKSFTLCCVLAVRALNGATVSGTIRVRGMGAGKAL